MRSAVVVSNPAAAHLLWQYCDACKQFHHLQSRSDFCTVSLLRVGGVIGRNDIPSRLTFVVFTSHLAQSLAVSVISLLVKIHINRKGQYKLIYENLPTGKKLSQQRTRCITRPFTIKVNV